VLIEAIDGCFATNKLPVPGNLICLSIFGFDLPQLAYNKAYTNSSG
jgi:hypothetical protein